MFTRHAFVLVVACGLAFPALAQSQKPAKDPLRGPAVKDRSVPGETRTMTGQPAERRDAGRREIPHPLFMRALGSLRGEKADEGVRLSPEQDDQIRVIDEDYRDEMQAFAAEHGKELRSLRAQLSPEDRRRFDGAFRTLARPGEGPEGPRRPRDSRRPADGANPPPPPREMEGEPPAPGQPPAPGEPAPRPDAAAAADARERAKELFEKAPKAAETHEKIMAILTDAQRPVFEKALADARKDLDSRERRDARDKTPGAEAPLTLDDPRIPERARERLKRLPPEQQQEALRRLRERTQRPGQTQESAPVQPR